MNSVCPPPPRPQISQFQLSLLFPLILVVILTTVLLIILLFSNSSSSCSSPVSAYVFFYFLSEQCLQQWYFKPGFHRAHRAADHISLKSHQFLSLSLGSWDSHPYTSYSPHTTWVYGVCFVTLILDGWPCVSSQATSTGNCAEPVKTTVLYLTHDCTHTACLDLTLNVLTCNLRHMLIISVQKLMPMNCFIFRKHDTDIMMTNEHLWEHNMTKTYITLSVPQNLFYVFLSFYFHKCLSVTRAGPIQNMLRGLPI